MDLSQLSNEDLLALQKNDLSQLSNEGLMFLQRQNDPEGYAKSQQQKQDASTFAGGEDASGLSRTMKALGGAKTAFDRAAYGLKGIFTDLSDEDKAQLAQGRAFNEEAGGFATAGEIAGDMAMTAGPAGALYKGVRATGKALPKLLQKLYGGKTSAATVAGGATGAAVSPEDRATGAVFGGVGGAAGDLAGRGITKLAGGLDVSAEARRLMDMGVDVPAWKAVQNKLLRGGFESSKALPVLGNAIRKSEREGIESFNRVMANNATPPTPVLDDAGRVIRWETNPVNATGTDAINALSDRFDQSYKALYDGRGIPMDDTFTQETADILANTQNYFPRITDEVSGAFRQVDDVLRRGTESTTTTSPILNQSGSPFTNTTLGRQTTSPSAVKQAMDALDARIKSAYLRGDGDTGQTLSALRDQVSDLRTRGLPPEVAGELGSVNKAYASFKQLQKANSSLGAQSADVLTPRQVLGAVKANDRSPNRSAFTKGKALNQQTVLDADRVLGSRLPEVGPGTAEKLIPLMMLSSGGLGGLATGAPIHGLALGALAMGATTKAGQKYLLGQQPGQATARAVGNRFLSPALRQFGAVEGAKYGREEQ